jgi:hypothetical protein
MRLTTRRLLIAGFATALFSGVGLASAAAAEPDHTDRVSGAVSLSATEEPLPGGDSTVPGVALGLLLGSAGLAWIVRRSAPAPAAVAPDVTDELPPVADLSPRRQPAGTKPSVSRRAAA